MQFIVCAEESRVHYSNSLSLWGHRLNKAAAVVGLITVAALEGGVAEGAGSITHGNAYGEQLSLTLQTLLANVQASSGPLPSVSGDTTPFNQDATTLSVSVGLGGQGNVLRTGLLLSHTDSSSPTQVSSNATVHNLGVSLLPAAPLLSLQADEVQSSAAIGGACGALTTTGSSNLANAGLGGTLGLGLKVSANPAPNTVLLNLLGLRVVLNEQILGGDGMTSRSIGVNAIHISLQNSLLGALGRLTGDIVIAHSEAQVSCALPPPIPVSKADLGLTLTAAPNPVTVGQTLTYSLDVLNAGPATATSTLLSNALPAGVTLISAQPSTGSCSGASTLSCSLGSIAAGKHATITIQATPNVAGNLIDTASVASSVADPNAANNNASITVTAISPAPQPMADLSLTLTATPNPVTLGQTLTYSLNVTNSGPSAAANATLSNVLPAGVSLVSIQPSQGSCTGTTLLSCALGTLAAGARASIVIMVIPGTPGTLTDTASASSGVQDPDTSNNSASATVNAIQVPGEADLALSLGSDENPVETGQILTYYVDVANFGPSDAAGVTLSNSLPDGVSLVSVQTPQGSCTGTTTLSCALGTIAAGADVTVTIQVIVNTVGVLVDTASATSYLDDPDPSNNEGSVVVTADGPAADLTLALAANPHPVQVGKILTYTLTISNAGPSDATDVTLSNQLPASVSLISVQPSQGSCKGTTVLTCSLGTMISGADASIEIQVIPSQAGQITDTASVTNSTGDPDSSNNSASITVIVYTGQEPQADLSLTKRANVSQIGVGAQFTYTLTITNAGPDAATGVVMTDPMPAGMTMISLQASQGNWSGTDTLTWNVGTLANGASATVILTVIAQQSGIIVNQASVASSSIDLNDANNTDSATVNVRSAE
jgi:uncharacterized repeat protein (TIGR01451 family)